MPPTDGRPTPTVTSYPDQNPNTYHPKVWGEEKLTLFMYLVVFLDWTIISVVLNVR